MEFGIKNTKNAQEEIANATNPNIRLFLLKKSLDTAPTTGSTAKWAACTPENIVQGGWFGFTAVGYFFGRDLQKALSIPIGLIETSWGGTLAEAWTSREALTKSMPEFKSRLDEVAKIDEQQKSGVLQQGEAQGDWIKQNDITPAPSTEGFDASGWKTMKLPTVWESSGDPELAYFDGVVWFRRSFDVPEAMPARKPISGSRSTTST